MPPRFDLLNGQIRGYYVGYKAANGSGHYVYKTVTPSILSDSPYTLILSALQPFTEYAIILQAFNSVGAGPRSDEIFVSTFESSPSGAPSDIKCEAMSSTSLKISWNPLVPPKSNGNLLGYRVRYNSIKLTGISGGATSSIGNNRGKLSPVTVKMNEVDALTTHLTLSNLYKFTNYSIAMSAFTRVGEGPKSTDVICCTLQDTPMPPAAVKAAFASSDSIILSWLPPKSPNGIVKTYTIYRKSHPKNETASPTTAADAKNKAVTFTVPAHVDSFTATQLTKRQVHSFWVTASTSVGEGEASQIVSMSLDQETGKLEYFLSPLSLSLSSLISVKRCQCFPISFSCSLASFIRAVS